MTGHRTPGGLEPVAAAAGGLAAAPPGAAAGAALFPEPAPGNRDGTRARRGYRRGGALMLYLQRYPDGACAWRLWVGRLTVALLRRGTGFRGTIGRLSLGWFRRCRACGCWDLDCSGCVARTGLPCHWVEKDLCSACARAVRA